MLPSLYSSRSERQLCERIDADLPFRWFLDLQPSEEAFDHAIFSHTRKRLDDGGLIRAFFDAVVAEAFIASLYREHFSVDGTLIKSFASAKSFQPIPATATEDSPGDSRPCAASLPNGNGFNPSNPEVDFHGQKRTNQSHRSQTDPEAKLYRKGMGKEAKLSHLGQALNENRNGLIVGIQATEASGPAERKAALEMVDELKSKHGKTPKTLGADKGYDTGEFFLELEKRSIEPHVPRVKAPRDPKAVQDRKQNAGVEAWQRMRERAGRYRLSQKCTKKIEKVFGWLKGIAGPVGVGRWGGSYPNSSNTARRNPSLPRTGSTSSRASNGRAVVTNSGRSLPRPFRDEPNTLRWPSPARNTEAVVPILVMPLWFVRAFGLIAP